MCSREQTRHGSVDAYFLGCDRIWNLAEVVGFEPTKPGEELGDLGDRCNRPLCDTSRVLGVGAFSNIAP